MKSRYYLILLLAVFFSGCDEYLDVKPDKALIVPTELEDFQALLDNDRQMLNQDLGMKFIGADNYYLDDDSWTSLSTYAERNGYIWKPDIYEGETAYDWNLAYEQIFIANVVLDGLGDVKVTSGQQSDWEHLKGIALFFRAYAFYNLLEQFAVPYDLATAKEMPGIPLRMEVDMEAPVFRSDLQKCYDEVVGSLKEAAGLLAASTQNKTRPDKAAAYGLLARVYLSMKDYSQALDYADKCLALHNELMDYNSLDPAAPSPFLQYNQEVIFHSVLSSFGIRRRALVASGLYSSYSDDDLRKSLFFSIEEGGSISFTGTYSNSSSLFSGIATDEVYLIRAECRARAGDVNGAMRDLNSLLETRWLSGAYEPFTAADADEALIIILKERRKELLFRGLRWTDLRRLNQDTRFAKSLTRTLNGKTYTLPPNDPRYVYPIPQQEIDISGIQQNPR